MINSLVMPGLIDPLPKLLVDEIGALIKCSIVSIPLSIHADISSSVGLISMMN